MTKYNIDLLGIGIMATGFGAYALSLGYDSVVISAVIGLLGTIGGYIVGKRQTEN